MQGLLFAAAGAGIAYMVFQSKAENERQQLMEDLEAKVREQCNSFTLMDLADFTKEAARRVKDSEGSFWEKTKAAIGL